MRSTTVAGAGAHVGLLLQVWGLDRQHDTIPTSVTRSLREACVRLLRHASLAADVVPTDPERDPRLRLAKFMVGVRQELGPQTWLLRDLLGKVLTDPGTTPEMRCLAAVAAASGAARNWEINEPMASADEVHWDSVLEMAAEQADVDQETQALVRAAAQRTLEPASIAQMAWRILGRKEESQPAPSLAPQSKGARDTEERGDAGGGQTPALEVASDGRALLHARRAESPVSAEQLEPGDKQLGFVPPGSKHVPWFFRNLAAVVLGRAIEDGVGSRRGRQRLQMALRIARNTQAEPATLVVLRRDESGVLRSTHPIRPLNPSTTAILEGWLAAPAPSPRPRHVATTGSDTQRQKAIGDRAVKSLKQRPLR